MTARNVLFLTALLALGFVLGDTFIQIAEAQDVPADAGVVAAADAPPASTMPDPVADPVATGSLVWKLYKGGALVPAILVGLFAVCIFLSRYVKWLSEGKRAVWMAGALAGLALLAEPASRGTTPNLAMIVAALSAMTALILAPESKPKA